MFVCVHEFEGFCVYMCACAVSLRVYVCMCYVCMSVCVRAEQHIKAAASAHLQNEDYSILSAHSIHWFPQGVMIKYVPPPPPSWKGLGAGEECRPGQPAMAGVWQHWVVADLCGRSTQHTHTSCGHVFVVVQRSVCQRTHQ